MRDASLPQGSYLDQPPLGRRLGGLGVALAITALLVLMLLKLAPPFDLSTARRGFVSFGLLPERAATPTATKSASKPKQVHAATHAKATVSPKARPQVDVTKGDWTSGMIVMSREDFAATDIAKLPSHKAEQAAGEASADAGAGGGSAGGGGPGGDRLYDVDWYRRPTDAELSFYKPKNNPPEGWGEVACKVIADHHVEDCHILGESPPGSGWGRAVLNASWQFRVMPPRIGSKELLGTWVRIHIDYLARGAVPG
ncbi:MAG: hypothetical protein JOY99_08570 [Sphingomonadaceae bacterium]|nr:hypothetical protein [Sphingomonadaceae bacterium]